MALVIVTRPLPSQAATCERYQQAGHNTHQLPLFDIQTNTAIQRPWLRMSADVWIILSVHALQHALRLDPDLMPAAQTRVIAVGPAVVKAWQAHFDHPIEAHPKQNSEGVIALLSADEVARIKIFTTADGRDLIRRNCMEMGISYCQLNTYLRVPLVLDEASLWNSMQGAEEVILTATSSDILKQLTTRSSPQLLSQLLAARLIVGAPRIAALAEQLGYQRVELAASPADVDMVAASLV